MTNETDIGLADVVGRFGGVFGVVKNKDLAHDTSGGNQTGVLGHVTRPVDFAVVGDALQDLDL